MLSTSLHIELNGGIDDKKPLTAPTTLKGLLLSVLLALSPAAFAEDNITFLGTQTDIADRDLRHGGSLSERLEQATTYCEAVASSTRVRKAKNEDRVLLRVQVKCLKERVKHLSESHSRGHHKSHHGHKRHSHHHRSPLISKDEKNPLLAIIKQFKQDGVLTGNDGASVAFAANSFVDSNGDLVTGNIQLTITPVDVANSVSLGEFAGI